MSVLNFYGAQLLFEMLIFGVLGLGLEVVFTSALDARKDSKRQLMGYSSLWYLPLYMLPPVFLNVTGWFVLPLPLIVRGLIYMAAIFLVEYVGMFCLRKLLGVSPSEAGYYQSRWNLHGLIRLDYAPAMFLMGLVFELVYRRLH